MNPLTHLDALIVGAGYSGLTQLHLLRKLNLKVRVVEAESNFGGIWFWNDYPGLRVDTVSPEYSLNIDEVNKDWTWSEKFASRDEIMRYLEHADNTLCLSKGISFNTKVLSAEYNNDNNMWNIHTTSGDYVTKYFILCVGIASKRYVPDFKGLANFNGIWHHTSAWPREEVDCRGKRVAVIGTGASGVQIVQELGPQSSHLSLFQRTPNLCLPMNLSPLDSDSQKKTIQSGELKNILNKREETSTGYTFDIINKNTLDDTPEERREFFEKLWALGGFHFWVAGYRDLFSNKEANTIAYDFWAEKTRERIKDQKKRDILAPLQPPHAFGTKRPSLEVRYYEVCDQNNVDIIDIRSSTIDHISSSSIITSDGVEHGPFDIIVLATGYDTVIGSILNIDIKGKEGNLLKEKWSQGIKTYLGMTYFDFPNLFSVYGVQAPTAFVNGPPLLNAQAEWVANCIEYLQQNGKERIEVIKEAEERWSKTAAEGVNSSLFAETESWYFGANIPGRKREPLSCTGGLNKYVQLCKNVANKGYEGFVLD